METGVHLGPAALDRLDDLAPLLHHVDAPVTAGTLWWRAWARSRSATWQPVLVTVHDGPELVAAAGLAVRRGPLLDRIVGWGDEESDVAVLPARDPAAATLLAEAVLGFLRSRSRPWSLRWEQLPAQDSTVEAVLAGRPDARIVRGDGCPQTPFDDDRVLASHLTRNGRKALNQARNRLVRAGLEPVLATVTDVTAVTDLLGEVVGLRRRRDHAMGRPAALDRPERRVFYETVLTDLARYGQVELTTAHLQGRLVAYVLALRDGSWLRLWDGRVDPEWDSWSLGRVVDLHVLDQALQDRSLTGLDWMRGEESYKRRAAPATVQTVHLLATSGRLVAAWVAAPGVATDLARRLLHASPRAREVVRGLKRRALAGGSAGASHDAVADPPQRSEPA